MADTLLTQADIDKLIKQQPVKVPAGPKPKSQAGTNTQNRGSVVQEIGSKDSKTNEPADKKVDSTVEDRLLNIEKRLDQVESVFGNIDKLEKSISSINQKNQLAPENLQEIMKNIQDLSREVSNISSKLKGTLGYGAYQTFKCDKCSSQGNVATVLKCTQCGKESWRGWWPKK